MQPTCSRKMSPLLAFSLLLNSIQPVLTGVANGAGQQGIVTYVNLGSYYLVGIPLGVLFGYVFKLQVQGVWMGMIIRIGVQTSILAIMTCTTDRDKQISLAQKRINPRSVEDEPTSLSLRSRVKITTFCRTEWILIKMWI